jgi:hypothetical protein
MKFSKNACLGLGLLFTIDFFFSLFDDRSLHELLFWEVNIWIYRVYRFLIAFIFIIMYFNQQRVASKE